MRRRIPTTFAHGVAAIVCTGLVACATPDLNPFNESPPKLVGAVVAGDSLNPRRDGQSTSVVLRVFQLEAPATFSQADFFTLYESGEATLGPGSLALDLVVLPSSVSIIDELELAPGTTHVGVLAAFRDWENATWRGVLETPPDGRTILNVQLDGSDLTVERGKRGWLRKMRKEAKNK